MSFDYWLEAFLCLLSALVSGYVMRLALNRREVPGSKSLALLTFSISVWSLTYALHWFSIAPEVRRFWLDTTYLGVVLVPPAFLGFAIQYTNRDVLFQFKQVGLFAIIPILTLLLLWTDDLHGLFYGIHSPGSSIYMGGHWFWFNTIYSYLLILLGLGVLCQSLFQTPKLYRRQIGLIILAALFPFAGSLAGIFRAQPLPDLDPTPFAFTLTGVLFAIGQYRYRLFDLAPIAKDLLIENMPDGMIVLDIQSWIVDATPAAALLLQASDDIQVGVQAEVALSHWPEIIQLMKKSEEIRADHRSEIEIGSPLPHFIEVRISPILGRRSEQIGRLIALRDITNQKLAEESERQERTLAEALRDSAAALNSTLVFEEVLKNVLENAGRVVPHEVACFMRVQYDHAYVTHTFRYYDNIHAENLWKTQMKWKENPLLVQVAEARQALSIPDASEDYAWVDIPGNRKICSFVTAPVFLKDELLGFIHLGSGESGYFNRQHAERLQAFANQAAISMQNARLFAETRQKAEQLSILNQVGLAITSGLEMDQVLLSIYTQCCKVAEVDSFYIAIYEEQKDLVSFPLFYDRNRKKEVEPYDLAQQSGLTGKIIISRQPIYLPDTRDPEASNKYQILHCNDEWPRSYLGVPIQLKDHILGVISMQSYKPDAYTAEHLNLLETIATQAAVALENARLYSYVQHLAIVDELTQVYNFRGLMEIGSREVERARRFNRPLSAIFFDIDHFRRFNSQYGHQTGNLVLKNVAACVQNTLRSINLLARYGGEEFVVLLPEADSEVAKKVAERLRKEVENLRVAAPQGNLGVTISLGVIEMDDSMRNLEVLLACANEKERLAKQLGRNRVEG